MLKYGEFSIPEEYMGLRKMVGWVEFYEKFGFRVRPNDDVGPGMD